MNMQMRHTLAACQTLIDADVVAIRLMAFIKDLLGLSQRAQQSDLLLFCGIEQRGKVALGNDYGMSRRNGKAIFVNHSEIVFGKNARGIENAERAGFGDHGVGAIQERFDVRPIILMRHGKRKNPRLGDCLTLESSADKSREVLAGNRPRWPLFCRFLAPWNNHAAANPAKNGLGVADFHYRRPKSDKILAEKTIFPVRFCWRCRLYGGGAIRYHSVSLYQPIL